MKLALIALFCLTVLAQPSNWPRDEKFCGLGTFYEASYSSCLSCQFFPNNGYCKKLNAIVQTQRFCSNGCSVCQNLNGAYQCVECSKSYQNYGNICFRKNSETSRACIQYDNNEGYCTKCETGFYLTLNKFQHLIETPCAPCGISNCALCTNNMDCQECSNGYVFKFDELAPGSQNSYIRVCKQNSAAEGCNILNCSYCNKNLKCESCLTGYSLEGGNCVKLQENCMKQSLNNGNLSCSQCENEYYLTAQATGNTCSPCSSLGKLVLYCGTQLDNPKLKTKLVPTFCEFPAQLYLGPNQDPSEGECLLPAENVKNCVTLNAKDKTKCDFCQKTQLEYKNTENSFIQDQNSICLQCPANCEACTLNSDNTAKCSTCQYGFFLLNGVCTACAQNVEECKSLTLATKCEPNFMITINSDQSETCKQTNTNCYKAGTDGNCVECNEHFQLINKVCVQLPEGCKQLNKQLNGCESCLAGFQSQGNGCVMPANCADDANNDGCNTCSYKYYRSSGKCLSCTDGQTYVCRSKTYYSFNYGAIIAVLSAILLS